jgi:DNA-binding IclR family transcriptional regulator
LKEVRRVGYAINNQENRDGVYSVGSPVRDSNNTTIGAISGAIAVGSFDRHGKANLIKMVVEASRRASQKLGARMD